jgi:hypothetical protein
MQSDKEVKDKSVKTLADDRKMDSGDDGEEGVEGNESQKERKKKRGTSEEAVQPRPLHRTASIFLRNLAPTITKQEVEAVSRLCICTTKILPTGHTQKNCVVSKVDKKLFLTLHGHNIHCQQWELSKYLI